MKNIKFFKALCAYISNVLTGEATPYEDMLHTALFRGTEPKVANRQATIFSCICTTIEIVVNLVLAAMFMAIIIAIILIFG